MTVDNEDFDVNTPRCILGPLLWPLVAICSPFLNADPFRFGETALVHRIRTVFVEQYRGLFSAGVGAVELDKLVIQSFK